MISGQMLLLRTSQDRCQFPSLAVRKSNGNRCIGPRLNEMEEKVNEETMQKGRLEKIEEVYQQLIDE